MIWGLEFNTEGRGSDQRIVSRWPNEEIAKAERWREGIGPRGQGPAFSPTNNHRIVRVLYQTHVGFQRGKHGADYVALHGTYIEPA